MPPTQRSPAPPTVTVVVPTRDRPALLARALRSALAQEAPPLEVVVVDDGTRDRAAVLEVVRAARGPVRLLRHGSSAGWAAARNRGLAVARGAWVTFLDEADVWVPDALARQLEALAAAPGTGWCLAGAALVDDRWRLRRVELPPPPEVVRETLQRRDVLPRGGSVVLARTALVRELEGFDPRLRHLDDWDLRVRLAARADVACAPAPLVVQRRPDRGAAPPAAELRYEADRVLARAARVLSADGDEVGSAWEELTAGRPITAGGRAVGAALRRPRRPRRATAAGPRPASAWDRAAVVRLPREVRAAATSAVARARAVVAG